MPHPLCRKAPAQATHARAGFTLFELLIVMLIISIGFMGVAPRLTRSLAGINPVEEFFTQQLKAGYEEAVRLGHPVVITGVKGSSAITTATGDKVNLPENLLAQEVRINGEATEGLEYTIAIYPDRLCDAFTITFDNGKTLESIPLLLGVRTL